MSCNSGCCRTSVETTPERDIRTQSLNPDDGNQCFGDEKLPTDQSCDDVCCSKNEPDDLANSESTGCRDACCDEPSGTVEKDDDCCENDEKVKNRDSSSPDDILPICQKSCCGESTDSTPDGVSPVATNIKTDSNCCIPESAGRKCSVRSIPTPTRVEVADTPSCCTGKTSPCCDVSCLERIALRECEDQKPVATAYEISDCEFTPIFYGSDEVYSHSPRAASAKSRTSSKRCKGKDGKPCSHHARAAREKYMATLEALGCICRALLALGQQSCCAPRAGPSVCQKRKSSKSCQSTPRTSVGSCCAANTEADIPPAKMRLRSKKTCRQADSGSQCRASPGPSQSKAKGFSDNDSCVDACCAEQTLDELIGKPKQKDIELVHPPDLEKGLAHQEHVVLTVSGMTCTGCETKLKRSLGTIRSVKNLKTSLVLARAEFDLDLSAGSAVEVMKHLERTTEFKCERIMNEGSNIDLITTSDSAIFVQKTWPRGVTQMTAINKNTVRVAFDAHVVGARELLEGSWGPLVKLAPLRADPTIEVGSKHVRHIGLMTILSAVLTVPVLVLAWAPLPKREIAYGSASLVLATIVQCVIAGPFYPKALKSLVFSRMIEMDLLIVLSTSAAFVFSVVSFANLAAGHPLSTGEFFETSTLLVTLIMVGRYVGALARQKAIESISIRSLQASTATLVKEGGGEMEVDARMLQYGDIFQVAPDSRMPTDGIVIFGSSEVDEAMITGETRSVEKHPGSPVVAGSVNGPGTLTVRLTRLPNDNTISTIAGMVDEAKLSKPKIQDMADRVASYFVPCVVLITLITFVVWVAIGIAVRKQSGAEAATQSITYAITVLIVSCPCAIGLAVPMVIVIASGVAAEKGVVFKSSNSIEIAHKTSHVVLDKTGTLTEGKLAVAYEETFGTHPKSTMSLLLGLISSIKHPVSVAVAAHLRAKGVSESVVSNPKSLTGQGVEGNVSDMLLRAGNSRWLSLSSDPRVQPVLSQGYTVFCFTVNDSLAAVFGLEDSLRPETLPTLAKLRQRGIMIHVISGDDDGAVRSVATQLSIPHDNIRSRCSPADKQAYVQDLLATRTSVGSSRKSKSPVIIFCGDGTNDAVALAQATIGIHMNQGTDVAKSAADVVLMRSSLDGILTVISVSEKAMHRIKFNFGWSFVYNLFAILLGAGAFVNARILPAYAGLGELVSVLPVIAAAVHLRWSKI